jgi:hypothetical protein
LAFLAFAVGLLALLAVAAMRTAFFGRDAQAVLTMGALVASTARAWPNMPKPRKTNPVSAPSAAGLKISALTCASSLQSVSWAGQSLPSIFLTLFMVGLEAYAWAQWTSKVHESVTAVVCGRPLDGPS